MNGDAGIGAELGDLGLAVPDEHLSRWKEHTYVIRSCELVLSETADPKPGSSLAQVDALYRWEKVSAWTRSYLQAATEHLGLWADRVAPYAFDPNAPVLVRIRPYLLLGRSGLEAAAHALWLFEVPTKTHVECIQRFVRLMYRDFGYHRDALTAHGDDTTLIEQRIADLEQRADNLPFETAPRNTPPGYERLVRHAAEVTGRDANQWSYLWQAASGAGHGQNWFSIEGFDLLHRSEYEPGHYRAVSIPDPAFVTDLIGAAAHALQWATCRWLLNAGYEPDLLARAVLEISARMPKTNPSTSESGSSTR